MTLSEPGGSGPLGQSDKNKISDDRRSSMPFVRFKAARPQRNTTTYPQATLLGLPVETRCQIWAYIAADMEVVRHLSWQSKPTTGYESLALVSRQLHNETDDLLHSSIVPQNRVLAFLYQPYTGSKFINFKSLSLEVAFNMKPINFDNIRIAFNELDSVLEHLQLFFTGNDGYGTRVFLHGCGHQTPSTDSIMRKLPADGQGFEKRCRLINSLRGMKTLKTLVLSNLNIPLLQSQILLNKPFLKKLSIESDPRTTVHFPWKRGNCGDGVSVPVVDNFPPVEELYLSANSVLGSVQVPGKLSPTLKKLTWVVPIVARQAGRCSDWYEATSIILMNLRSNSTPHTLRMCIEGSVYEGHHAYGSLIGAFREHMPFIPLKYFELHLCSKSPYIAGEFIEALPMSLERFYAGDRFISPSDLVQRISNRYFPHHNGHVATEYVIGTSEDLSRGDFINLVYGSLGFVSYEYTNNSGERVRMIEHYDDADEMEGDTVDREISGTDEDTLALLHLNGRLLDRERNKHLLMFLELGNLKCGQHTPPRMLPTEWEGKFAPLAEDRDELLAISARAMVLDGDEIQDIPELDEVLPFGIPTATSTISRIYYETDREESSASSVEFSFPANSVIVEGYFGNEDEAMQVFNAEVPAFPQVLPTLKYPKIVPCPTGYEHYEHWMCN
jgi:hypothetical protein